jgi:hypothetical protein
MPLKANLSVCVPESARSHCIHLLRSEKPGAFHRSGTRRSLEGCSRYPPIVGRTIQSYPGWREHTYRICPRLRGYLRVVPLPSVCIKILLYKHLMTRKTERARRLSEQLVRYLASRLHEPMKSHILMETMNIIYARLKMATRRKSSADGCLPKVSCRERPQSIIRRARA